MLNVRLGDAAKLPAVSGSLAANGWAKIPMSGSKSLIIQWGIASVTASLQGTTKQYYDGSVDFKFPVEFPSALLVVNATPLDSGDTVIETATAGIWGNKNVTVRVGGATIKSTGPTNLDLNAYVIGIGY